MPSPLLLVDHNLFSESTDEVGFVNAEENSLNLNHFSTSINHEIIGQLEQDYIFQIRNFGRCS